MDIKTRFSKGDTVYYLYNGGLKFFTVESINVSFRTYSDANFKQQKEYYSDDIYGAKDFIDSNDLYATIEDLLKNLEENKRRKD